MNNDRNHKYDLALSDPFAIGIALIIISLLAFLALTLAYIGVGWVMGF